MSRSEVDALGILLFFLRASEQLVQLRGQLFQQGLHAAVLLWRRVDFVSRGGTFS